MQAEDMASRLFNLEFSMIGHITKSIPGRRSMKSQGAISPKTILRNAPHREGDGRAQGWNDACLRSS